MLKLIRSTNAKIRLAIIGLLFINTFRFLGLEFSPSGINLDEAAGAAQIMCIAQTGYDFFGNFLPIFIPGLPGQPGQFTISYIYGQIAWGAIFGYGIDALRSFLGFITCLTILLLYLFVRNRSDKKTALLVAFSASVMPWAFQFSRIAWDPPLAVFFVVAGLWLIDKAKFFWLSGVCLALSAYSYPPMRIMSPLLLIFFPSLKIKTKLQIFSIFIFACIPLFLKLIDPEFMLRTNSLVIWKSINQSPYTDFGILNLPIWFLTNLIKNFNPAYLFINGASYYLFTIQGFGMLSYLDAFAYILGFVALLHLANKKIHTLDNFINISLLKIVCLGIIAALIPASLTTNHGGIPHALRSIGAWPFYALLTGLILSTTDSLISSHIKAKFFLKPYRTIICLIGLSFFSFYQYRYFTEYSRLSSGIFQIRYDLLDYAYLRMHRDGITCEEARNEPAPKGATFNFASNKNGSEYLASGWHQQEQWGVWSNGPIGKIHIFYLAGAKTVAIKVRHLAKPDESNPFVIVSINGMQNKISLNKIQDQWIKVNLPKSLKPNSILNIDLISPNPATPSELDLGVDDRLIGIGLIDIRLE